MTKTVSEPQRVALVTGGAVRIGRAITEALAAAASGFAPEDLDPEMIADGVGEFLNVLGGNAAAALTQQGHRVELGPPDYDAELGHEIRGHVQEDLSFHGAPALRLPGLAAVGFVIARHENARQGVADVAWVGRSGGG